MELNKKNKILNYLHLSKIFGFKYVNELDLSENTIYFDLPNDIDEINTIINNCSLCSFNNTSDSKIINNINFDNDILFISTFNLSQNDNTFKLMLKNVLNLDLNDVNLLTIIKCDVKYDENCDQQSDICKDYLFKQIEIIKPKLIVTLGDAYSYLINKDVNISSIRGNMLKYKNINLIPMYHPQTLLRNPSLKKDALLDLKKIKLLMESF